MKFKSINLQKHDGVSQGLALLEDGTPVWVLLREAERETEDAGHTLIVFDIPVDMSGAPSAMNRLQAYALAEKNRHTP
ncbi:MAG TPA: hypothetical protein VHG72_16545 [Polyangia bacterium]|nr:hypothetical protein [Polyangia bacterium]